MTTPLDQRGRRSRRRPWVISTAVVALMVGGLALTPAYGGTVTREQLAAADARLAGATASSPAYLRLYEERAAMAESVSLIDEEALMEADFNGATSGSPAQVRARDSTDLLLESMSASITPSP